MNELVRRSRSWLPWVWTVMICIGGVVLLVIHPLPGEGLPEVLINSALTLVYAFLGLLIAVKQPGNRIAWVLLVIAASSVLSGIADVQIDGRPNPGTAWDALAIIWANTGYFVTLLIPLLLLVYIFPTGEFLSRWWSLAGWAAGIAIVTLLFVEVFAVEVGPDGEAWTIRNPLGFHSLAGIDGEGAFAIVFGISLIALVVGAPVAIIVRYIRSSGEVRAQIKYVLLAMALIPLIFVSGTVLPQEWAGTVVYFVALAMLPATISIAVVRNNLFDIDVVISKSLTFGVLLMFIGVVYVAIVVGVGQLVGGGDGSSFGLSLVATAVVAVAFQPVRGRVERWANRLVYGKRATPYEVLARFSHRASENDDDVLGRIPRIVVDGTGASDAKLWVLAPDGFHTASVWPPSDVVQTLGAGDGFEDPDADLSLPVVHDGELLGGISLVAARGGTITPTEQELVTNLAEGLGLTLRNSQLTAALRRQVKDLQRSRDRVVSAADDARRTLEHDLDSGPQQQLVAVKVKLGPLYKLAEQASAVKTATMLGHLQAQAGDAIQAVRDFAAGIYPPLLGAEGLVVALGQETNKAAVPVEIEADGVGRYPRDIESAVYFSILEAVQNSAKYADASQTVVRLTQMNGALSFEVIDNGRGFDPSTVDHGSGLNGIGDRIDIIGGTWTITSQPGKGTAVSGSVPVSDR